MITSIHTLIYSDDAPATRAFLRDVLGWPYVEDAQGGGAGWLIFRSGRSEMGVHPTHINLSVDQVTGTRLFLYTQKTGVPVNLILPPVVCGALERTPMASKRYWFWSGVGELETAVTNWRARLHRLFEIAKIPDGHAHRFRDTFAVELLLAGVPIERVSVLLGHQSVRITEKHYSPWAKSRQEQLEADLRKAWKNDLLAQGTETPGYMAGTQETDNAATAYFVGGFDGGAGGNRTHV
jgi:catechol 2,3-dioxygenase-like lactoylglutathione lyase family enzyme